MAGGVVRWSARVMTQTTSTDQRPPRVTVRRIWPTWVAWAKVIRVGALMTLMVLWVRRPWLVLRWLWSPTCAQGTIPARRVQPGLVGLDG